MLTTKPQEKKGGDPPWITLPLLFPFGSQDENACPALIGLEITIIMVI